MPDDPPVSDKVEDDQEDLEDLEDHEAVGVKRRRSSRGTLVFHRRAV